MLLLTLLIPSWFFPSELERRARDSARCVWAGGRPEWQRQRLCAQSVRPGRVLQLQLLSRGLRVRPPVYEARAGRHPHPHEAGGRQKAASENCKHSWSLLACYTSMCLASLTESTNSMKHFTEIVRALPITLPVKSKLYKKKIPHFFIVILDFNYLKKRFSRSKIKRICMIEKYLVKSLYSLIPL